MPDSKSDPESYSIDDMLDRLKNRDPQEGEAKLVTRADGTQALKVRKRKRRTDQSRDRLNAQIHRRQLIQIAAFLVFVVMLLLVIGGFFLYANSTGYRENLISKIEQISGSKVKLQQFRINPVSANASSIEMDWPKSHVLHRLEVSGLKAKIAPVNFLGKVFQGAEIKGSRANLYLSGASTTADKNEEVKPEVDPSVAFNRYFIPDLNVYFSKEPNQDRVLEKTEISYFHPPSRTHGEIRLSQGMLKMKGWPTLSLDRSYVRVRKGELDIQTFRLCWPQVQSSEKSDKGFIDFTGKIRPGNSDETHILSAQLDDFQIAYLLGEDLGRFFRGAVTNRIGKDESNQLKIKINSDHQLDLNLHLTQATGSRIQLHQLKFLGHLSVSLEDLWYETPIFDNDVEVVMKRNGDRVEIRSFRFVQRGRMVIKGAMTAEGEAGKISGNLKVGIPASIIEASDNRRLDILFSPEKDGYRWLDLELKGTGATPIDNFKDLYQAIDLTKAIPQTAETTEAESERPKQPEIDTFENLLDEGND